MVIRIPLIPGHNDSKQNITATMKFVKRFLPRVVQIDLLPFHQLGRKKFEGLDMKYTLKELKPPSKERVAEMEKTVESFGFHVTVGG
jgi:pyruvate formate lyase activating enzyme